MATSAASFSIGFLFSFKNVLCTSFSSAVNVVGEWDPEVDVSDESNYDAV